MNAGLGTGQQRTLVGKRGPLVTPLTDQQAVEVCGTLTGFGKDLHSRANGKYGLSSEQMWWAHKLALDVVKPQPKPAAASVGDVAGIIALFEVAGKTLKHPAVRLQTESGTVLRITRAGAKSKAPGSINVTSDGDYESRDWYGRIGLDGMFTRSAKCTDEIAALLVQFASDPAGVAAAYGKLTGSCCFCRHQLEEEGSVEVGYGPVCAGNWNLWHPQNSSKQNAGKSLPVVNNATV